MSGTRDPRKVSMPIKGISENKMSFDILNRWSAVLFRAANSANITEAFWEARKTGADLRHAVLTGAVLTGAVLTGAVLTGAVLTGADLRHAVLTGADLTGAVLTGAVLRDADLTGAVLTGADLRDADLTGAVLTGADLRDADLTDAKGLERFAVPGLAKRVAEEVLKGETYKLEMSTWHTCETTHCLAGMAIHLTGTAGYALEMLMGPSSAAALLMPEAAHLFHASNEKALEWLKGQAAGR